MDKLSLKAQKRTIAGRKVKSLRREGILPANVFGKNVKSQAIQIDLASYLKLYKEAGETSLVELEVDGAKLPVLIHNTQVDPVLGTPLHVDFLQVNLKEKVTAQVPVELTGESPAEKQGLGTVVQQINEVEVESLPADIPDKFEIDISGLVEVDNMIQVKDIKIDEKKVEIKDDAEQIIAKVEPQKEEKVEVPTEVAEGEPVEVKEASGEQVVETADEPKSE
jgi:large subunit ribosomal protein L25